MHFIFGGRHMGMLEYAQGLLPGGIVCDLAHGDPASIANAGIVCNLHLMVKTLLSEGIQPARWFDQHLPELEGKILIGDEVGSGVVPIEPFEREWRDETGRVYQLLARQASDVTRVWAGIPQALKRGGCAL